MAAQGNPKVYCMHNKDAACTLLLPSRQPTADARGACSVSSTTHFNEDVGLSFMALWPG